MSNYCFTPLTRRPSRQSVAYQFARGRRRDGELLSCLDVLNLWRSGDEEFHQTFTKVLCSCPFGNSFWECHPISFCTLERPFEFVLTDAGGQLSRTRACADDFSEHFRRGDMSTVTSYPNLRQDAMLVVPKQCRGNPKNMCARSLARLMEFLEPLLTLVLETTCSHVSR